jgi:hypothetical protein
MQAAIDGFGLGVATSAEAERSRQVRHAIDDEIRALPAWKLGDRKR